MVTGVCVQGHVVMGNNAVSPYQQVIEKTKSLSFRSQMLAMNMEKRAAHSTRTEVSHHRATQVKANQFSQEQTFMFCSSFINADGAPPAGRLHTYTENPQSVKCDSLELEH